MTTLASRAFLALLVLATVPSVDCTFDGSTPNPEFGSNYRGCYEVANDELEVVLNLGAEGNGALRGCLRFAKNGLPFEGPFTLIGKVNIDENNKAEMIATPFDIGVNLTRDVQTINFAEVVFISIDFPGGPPMEDIRRKFPEYVEETMCPEQCPQEPQ